MSFYVSRQTVGSVVRNAVGPYDYRRKGQKNFTSGIEVMGKGGNVEARFVNYSGDHIDNKEQVISQAHEALRKSGANCERVGDSIIVYKEK